MDALLDGRAPIRILDAGCGRRRRLRLPKGYATGIDISREALGLNSDLDEKILGDIEVYPLPTESYDVIYSWDVLEHVDNPTHALGNLIRSLRPNGLLIVGVPNLFSLKGVAAKWTPHAAHVWYYRRIRKFATAGQPGYPPFRTTLRLGISPPALRRLARTHGLEVVHLETYGMDNVLFPPDAGPFFWRALARPAWHALTLCIRAATLGRLDASLTEVVVIMRKPGAT